MFEIKIQSAHANLTVKLLLKVHVILYNYLILIVLQKILIYIKSKLVIYEKSLQFIINHCITFNFSII